jgi:WD40 repeat protein
VAFSPDGTLLATGGRDSQIRIWRVDTGEELVTLSDHSKPVLSLSFNPTGTLLVSGSGDNFVKLWVVPQAE